jgi:hypothetical protein
MDESHDHARRFGVELLEPFHDPELVELLLTMPPEHLFFRGRVKALSEASIGARVPELVPSLGVAWPDGAYESMVIRDGKRGLEFLDGVPVLTDLEIIAPNVLVKALNSGVLTDGVGYQEAWRTLALEAWLQCRVQARRPSQNGLTQRSTFG